MGGIFDTFDNGSNVTRSVTLHHRHRHDECLRIGTDDTNIIIGCSSDTGYVGTVHIVVTNLRRVVDEVPSMHIAYETVVVVIVTVHAIRLRQVGPDVVLQVRMRDVYTRVKNSDDGATAIDDGLVPQFLDTIAVKSPLLSQIGIAAIAVGNVVISHNVNLVVWLSKLHFLKGCQSLYHFHGFPSLSGLYLYQIQLAQITLLNGLSVVRLGTTQSTARLVIREQLFHLGSTKVFQHCIDSTLVDRLEFTCRTSYVDRRRVFKLYQDLSWNIIFKAWTRDSIHLILIVIAHLSISRHDAHTTKESSHCN